MSKQFPMLDALAEQVGASVMATIQPSEPLLKAIIANFHVHHPIYDELIEEMEFSPSYMMLRWDAAKRLWEDKPFKLADLRDRIEDVKPDVVTVDYWHESFYRKGNEES